MPQASTETSGNSGANTVDAVPRVYIVDDDEGVRDYVVWLLQSAAWTVDAFDSAQAFLDAFDPRALACLVTDVRMPGLSGLDLQSELEARHIHLPMIFISACASVPTAVRAMRGGAIDFLEKPFDGEILLQRVRAAIETEQQARAGRAEREEIEARLARLTPRQRAVLAGLAAGKPSKIIADELGVSPRTVDVHRFRLMHQLGADSLPELFRRLILVRGAPG